VQDVATILHLIMREDRPEIPFADADVRGRWA